MKTKADLEFEKFLTTSDGKVALRLSLHPDSYALLDTRYVKPGIAPGVEQHIRFNIIDPKAVVENQESAICIVPVLNAAITITNIKATCEVDPNIELDWNLRYADTFIARANISLISVLDTVGGVFDSGVISKVVPSGKCIYVKFDTTPAVLPNEVCVDITFKYN